jgi:hypothetical protein
MPCTMPCLAHSEADLLSPLVMQGVYARNPKFPRVPNLSSQEHPAHAGYIDILKK